MATPISAYDLRKRHTSQLDPLPEQGSVGAGAGIGIPPQTPLQHQKDPVETEKEVNKSQVINMKTFEEADVEEKLNLVMVVINNMNKSFHTDLAVISTQIDTQLNEEGHRITAKIKSHTQDIWNLSERVTALETSNADLQDSVASLKRLLQVKDKQITSLQNKVVDLTACSMANNFVIYGLKEQSQENCKERVLQFLQHNMKMDVNGDQVIVAHRLGTSNSNQAKPRPIVFRCMQELKEKVFKHSHHLKGQKNEYNENYYVRKQLPEPLHTQNKELGEQIKDIKKANAEIPDTEIEKKIKFEVKHRVLYVNGKAEKKYINAPTVADMFNVETTEQEKIDDLCFETYFRQKDKGSTFTTYAAQVHNMPELKLAYIKARQLSPEADHVMMAYSIKQYSGYEDHGEYGAGKRIQNILIDRQMWDTVVFVACVYGGVQLGPCRFLHIEKAMKEVLNKITASLH